MSIVISRRRVLSFENVDVQEVEGTFWYIAESVAETRGRDVDYVPWIPHSGELVTHYEASRDFFNIKTMNSEMLQKTLIAHIQYCSSPYLYTTPGPFTALTTNVPKPNVWTYALCKITTSGVIVYHEGLDPGDRDLPMITWEAYGDVKTALDDLPPMLMASNKSNPAVAPGVMPLFYCSGTLYIPGGTWVQYSGLDRRNRDKGGVEAFTRGRIPVPRP